MKIGDIMLGKFKTIKYGVKDVESFIPYTLNELYVSSKRSEEIDKLTEEIASLLPLPKPVNRSFHNLLLDIELLDQLNYDNKQYSFADLYSPSMFDLFSDELQGYKEIFEYAPEHLNKLGYSNRYIRDLHHAVFNKYHALYPGEFRRTVSFIGTDIDNATFISSEVEYMHDNMGEMELFMHRDDINIYTRSGLIYYQIMANLPFLIGNELMGRLVAQLYLREFGEFDHYIPLTRHFPKIERARKEAMEKQDINIYVKAYLKGLLAAVKEARKIINGFNRLKKRQQNKIESSGHTIYQKRRLNEVLNQSLSKVYVASIPIQDRFNVQHKTVIKRFRYLDDLGIIKCEKTYFQTLYFNKDLLKLIS